jgi:hypothetical protein
MGGARGFIYACILLRIGQLPDLSPEINAVYMKLGVGCSPAPFFDQLPAIARVIKPRSTRPRFTSVRNVFFGEMTSQRRNS